MSSVVSERARRHRDAQIVALGGTEQFKALLAEAEDEALRVRDRLYRELFSGVPAADLQRQASYDQGYLDALRYLTISVIKRAERGMERDQPLTDEEPERDRWTHGQW